jgi:CBS domain-containing protein
MQVKEIMTAEPAFCTPEMPLEKVARLMIEYDCGEIPVVDNLKSGVPIGVVTDRDITCRTIAQGLNPLEMTASECMSTPVVSVKSDAPLEECYRVMEENQIRRVLVVDGGKCSGIVSLADVSRRVSKADSAEILQEVSAATRSASNIA